MNRCYTKDEIVKELNYLKTKYQFDQTTTAEEILGSNQKLIEFDKTPKIPVYLFTLVSGEFVMRSESSIE